MNVFDTKSPLAIFYIFSAIIVMTVIFWGVGLQFQHANPIESIEQRKQQWHASRPANYSYTIDEGCMTLATSKVSVVDHRPYFEHGSSHNNTLEKLFNKAHKVIKSVEKYNITYNQEYGFVQSIDIDWRRDTIDDECFIRVIDFKINR